MLNMSKKTYFSVNRFHLIYKLYAKKIVHSMEIPNLIVFSIFAEMLV